MKDVIISFDVETYGHIPGLHSMASLGAVAYHNWKEVGSFYAVLQELKHSSRDEDTMKSFWAKQPKAWQEIQRNQEPPRQVMEKFYTWCTSLPGTAKNRVFAANPAIFDMPFLNFYAYKFLGDRREHMSYRMRCLDIRSYWGAYSGLDYSNAERFKMPQQWFEGLPNNHIAIDDARNQGVGFINMLRAALGMEDSASLDQAALASSY
jgi:DNA polymerase III alpha subunit (gram-positive type)